jgi:hypothetical protein
MASLKRDIRYLGKDFNDFRNNLIQYSQTYFPTSYNDFTTASPGMMLMELSAYVGDVMSFYLDNQFQETFLQYARQSNNIFELAYMFNYKPKVTGVATAPIDFYQVVPAIGNDPDFSYALFIEANSNIQSTSNSAINFLVEDSVNFAVSSSSDPTEVTIYESSAGIPQSYLLKKTRNGISATINTAEFVFGDFQEFPTVTINDDSIVGILDITDSNGNTWYEVDFLAQDMVYDSIANTNVNDPNYSSDNADVPYLLKLREVQRRFVSRFTSPTTLQLQFGSGNPSSTDEEIVPNTNNVGLGLPFEKERLTTAYSPTNFIFTNTYGIAPTNITLNVRYLTGGGTSANVPSNDLTTFSATTKFLNSNLSGAQPYFDSLQVTNPIAADGGQDGDSLQEIRQNSIANYASQQRNVTADDYLVRALSMPSKYGVIAKAFIEKTKLQNVLPGEIPSSLDLYILSYNRNGQLQSTSSALKRNLNTYLSRYRIIGDSINIKNAFIINIGVNFDIIVLPEYNSNDVLSRCISQLQSYFNIENWQINQPILLRGIYVLLDNIEGVQTVEKVEIVNKTGVSLGYSQYAYDTEGAKLNNTIYPSIDPMIFEVKYPNTDIQGRIVTL